MRDAAARQEFEEAARYRNRLTAVRHLAERQAADKRAIGTVDVIGIAARGRTAAVQVFPPRGGRLVDRHTFYLENEAGEDVPQLLESFCLEYYGGAPSVPPLIVVPPDAGPTAALVMYGRSSGMCDHTRVGHRQVAFRPTWIALDADAERHRIGS